MQEQASVVPRSPQQVKGAEQGLVRQITVLAGDTSGSAMAPSRPSDELSEVADLAECAQAAAKEAVAALSDDEATLEPPQDPRKMG